MCDTHVVPCLSMMVAPRKTASEWYFRSLSAPVVCDATLRDDTTDFLQCSTWELT